MAQNNWSFVIFIDESGDEGFRFKTLPSDKGSSSWFVLSAAVFRADYEPREVKCVDQARIALGRAKGSPLHFADLRHEHKVVYCREIAKANFRAISVAVYKPEISNRKQFRLKRWLYHYATKLLLERASWLCRARYIDQSQGIPGDGSAKVIFSHRRTYSQVDLENYLEKLQGSDECGIDWSVIIPSQIEAKPHHAMRGLQIADAIASSLYAAIESHPLGFTEARYVQSLCVRYYANDSGQILKYGFKPFPSTSLSLLTQSEWEVIRKMAGSRL